MLLVNKDLFSNYQEGTVASLVSHRETADTFREEGELTECRLVTLAVTPVTPVIPVTAVTPVSGFRPATGESWNRT